MIVTEWLLFNVVILYHNNNYLYSNIQSCCYCWCSYYCFKAVQCAPADGFSYSLIYKSPLVRCSLRSRLCCRWQAELSWLVCALVFVRGSTVLQLLPWGSALGRAPASCAWIARDHRITPQRGTFSFMNVLNAAVPVQRGREPRSVTHGEFPLHAHIARTVRIGTNAFFRTKHNGRLVYQTGQDEHKIDVPVSWLS